MVLVEIRASKEAGLEEEGVCILTVETAAQQGGKQGAWGAGMVRMQA